MSSTENWLMLRNPRTVKIIRQALEAMTIRAALDGKVDVKRDAEDALIDVSAAQADALPDRVSPEKMVQCFLTVGELKDMETAIAYAVTRAVSRGEKSELYTTTTPERLTEILRRLRISITLNPH